MYLNPFTPEPPITTRADPRPACGVISFNGQGQLCPLSCAEWRDLSNQTRMSKIQSRTPEKKAKNHVTLSWKFAWKSFSTTHLPFLSPNPKILKVFLKTFPTKLKPTKCPARENKFGKKSEKREEERKQKVKSRLICYLLPVHTLTSQTNILHLDQKARKCRTCKWLCGNFYLFIARQWPENRLTNFKMHFFSKISRGEWVNDESLHRQGVLYKLWVPLVC